MTKFTFLFFIFFIFLSCSKEEEINYIGFPNVVEIDNSALTCKSGLYGNIINGQSFQQDVVLSINGWQYVAYYNNDRKIVIARRNLVDLNWEKLILAGYKFSADPIYDNDTHNTISVGYCKNDGTLHLAFDTHANPLNYTFSVKGLITNPTKYKWDSTLFSPVINSLNNGVKFNEFSYPSFVGTLNGNLLLGYRDGYSGVLHYKLVKYDGISSNWGLPRIAINGSGNYDDYFSGLSVSRCAYVNGIDINKKTGKLFISWTWREDIRSSTTANRDIYASFSDDDGNSWQNSKGEKITNLNGLDNELFTSTNGIVVKTLDRGWGLMNQQSQSYDINENPHVIMYHKEVKENIPDFAKINNGKYFHYYLKDNIWVENKTPFIGNRPKFVFDKINNLYLIFVNKDHFDYVDGSGSLIIAKASSSSEWKDWKIIYKSESIYFSEPLIDRNRWTDSNVLSIFIQETPISEGIPSKLKLLEFSF